MKALKSKKIAVLCGGKSKERDVSLRSGKRVFNSLKKQGYKVTLIDAKDNLAESLKKNKIEIAFIALHGRFGEDGCVQALLELYGIPYTGSGVLASALGMHKIAAKRIWQSRGIPTPNFFEIDHMSEVKKLADRIVSVFPFPVVVKPVSEGSSFGVTIVKEGENLEGILKATLDEFDEIFIEEFVSGKEVTVGILEEEALPILELVPKNEFYDFESKYTQGGCQFILPARLNPGLYKETQRIALAAHKALGCRGFSRVDIIVGQDHTPYVHEINTIPGLTDLSDLPAEAAEAGIDFDELVIRILKSAIAPR